MKEYKCVCGKCFKSKQALVGHYANCLHHKEDLKQRQQKEQEEKETRRLPNGLFPCDNPDCNKEHDGSYGSGRFCCKKCRDHYNALQSYQTKKKNGTFVCNFNIHKDNNGRASYGTWKCEKCNLIFDTRAQLENHIKIAHPHVDGHVWNYGLSKETDERIARSSVLISKSLTGRCTSPIWTDKRRKKMTATCKKNKKSGGYRKNGGKGKRGRYKGFWCDSSWELAYVIWNLEHNVKFSRNTKGFPYVFENEVHQYHPDFLLEDGTYVEIKGWYDNKTLIKHQTFRDLGYKLQVIDKNNIEMYLTYAVKKYGNDFIKLYEET